MTSAEAVLPKIRERARGNMCRDERDTILQEEKNRKRETRTPFVRQVDNLTARWLEWLSTGRVERRTQREKRRKGG